jgi:hypothetical protein
MLKELFIKSFLNKNIQKYLNGYMQNNFAGYFEVLNASQNSLEHWFDYWLHFQNFSFAKEYVPKNCYYEFGTGWGSTLTAFLRSSIRFCKKNNIDISNIKIVLFDSFQGLPEEAAKEDYNPEWSKGKFAYSRDYITNIIKTHNFPLENVTFVEGFFEQSLTKEVQEKLKSFPPSIVTMDVDYYSSTKLALNFIAPLLKSGTVFYFDDLYSFFLHPDMGQPKAIHEFVESGQGYLQPLTHENHDGKCYIYTKKEWEHTSGSGN